MRPSQPDHGRPISGRGAPPCLPILAFGGQVRICEGSDTLASVGIVDVPGPPDYRVVSRSQPCLLLQDVEPIARHIRIEPVILFEVIERILGCVFSNKWLAWNAPPDDA